MRRPLLARGRCSRLCSRRLPVLYLRFLLFCWCECCHSGSKTFVKPAKSCRNAARGWIPRRGHDSGSANPVKPAGNGRCYRARSGRSGALLEELAAVLVAASRLAAALCPCRVIRFRQSRSSSTSDGYKLPVVPENTAWRPRKKSRCGTILASNVKPRWDADSWYKTEVKVAQLFVTLIILHNSPRKSLINENLKVKNIIKHKSLTIMRHLWPCCYFNNANFWGLYREVVKVSESLDFHALKTPIRLFKRLLF